MGHAWWEWGKTWWSKRPQHKGCVACTVIATGRAAADGFIYKLTQGIDRHTSTHAQATCRSQGCRKADTGQLTSTAITGCVCRCILFCWMFAQPAIPSHTRCQHGQAIIQCVEEAGTALNQPQARAAMNHRLTSSTHKGKCGGGMALQHATQLCHAAVHWLRVDRTEKQPRTAAGPCQRQGAVPAAQSTIPCLLWCTRATHQNTKRTRVHCPQHNWSCSNKCGRTNCW